MTEEKYKLNNREKQSDLNSTLKFKYSQNLHVSWVENDSRN